MQYFIGSYATFDVVGYLTAQKSKENNKLQKLTAVQTPLYLPRLTDGQADPEKHNKTRLKRVVARTGKRANERTPAKEVVRVRYGRSESPSELAVFVVWGAVALWFCEPWKDLLPTLLFTLRLYSIGVWGG